MKALIFYQMQAQGFLKQFLLYVTFSGVKITFTMKGDPESLFSS